MTTKPVQIHDPACFEGVEEVLQEVVSELEAQADRLAVPLRKTYKGQPIPSRTEIIRLFGLNIRRYYYP